MSFPASLTLVTVTIQLDALPSGGGAGTVQFISPRTVPLQGTSLVQPIDTTVEIGADGAGTIQLPAVDATGWSPAGWAYTVIGRTAHGSWRGTLQLLHTDTTVALHERLQIDGTATPGVSYLLLSQRGVAGGVAGLDDDGDVIDASGAKVTGGEGGGAAPGSTVVSETTFGQTATAGTGTAYARATHSHGTPALPSASDVGADASGTAAAAVTAHVEASDPHTEYALETSLGDAALLDVGTTAGTVAAGDDSRITGAAQKASNLSDLANAGTARTNLGLGGAATLSVGTSAGTVAAGDDSRITGAQQRSTLTTKGDLYVATAASTVARLGVGSDDQVLTADSSAPGGVAWADPLGGGGGGSTIVTKRGYVTSGDITVQNTSNAWQLLTGGPTFSIAAAVGDEVVFDWAGLRQHASNLFWDVAVIVSGAAVRYSATGTSSPGIEGDPSMYPPTDTSFPGKAGMGFAFIVESGDLSGGNVTVGFALKSDSTLGKLFAGTNYPLRWRLANYGPQS